MKKRSFSDTNHFIGRVFTAAAIGIILAVPIIMAIVLKTAPDFKVLVTGVLTLFVFLIGGVVEVITYAPILGTNGTYLGFITGNLANLKVPCAVNAREAAGVKNGSQEGEIVSTVSIAASTITTTIIIAIGVALLVPLTPVLESETLAPAFHTAFAALFGGLAYKYFVKDLKLVPVPLGLAAILAATLHLGSSLLIPICSVVAIIYAFAIFKLTKKRQKM